MLENFHAVYTYIYIHRYLFHVPCCLLLAGTVLTRGRVLTGSIWDADSNVCLGLKAWRGSSCKCVKTE